jgi:hypothetical protein
MYDLLLMPVEILPLLEVFSSFMLMFDPLFLMFLSSAPPRFSASA